MAKPHRVVIEITATHTTQTIFMLDGKPVVRSWRKSRTGALSDQKEDLYTCGVLDDLDLAAALEEECTCYPVMKRLAEIHNVEGVEDGPGFDVFDAGVDVDVDEMTPDEEKPDATAG